MPKPFDPPSDELRAARKARFLPEYEAAYGATPPPSPDPIEQTERLGTGSSPLHRPSGVFKITRY